MKTVERGPAHAWFGGRGSGLAQVILIAVLSGGLLWIVALYGAALRDPRYLDGWVLAGGIAAQISYHIAAKAGALSPRWASRWRGVHIFIGFLLIAAFVSHSDFSLPDTAFEWALSASFVLVASSGVFGSYLAWSMQAKLGLDERMNAERLAARRAELAQTIHTAVASTDPAAAAIPLPATPYDDWIRDLYTNRLRFFFAGRRNFTAHLIGSQRPLKQLMAEMDSLAKYLDRSGEAKLGYIRTLVVEKDRLDLASVYADLTRAWLMIHVPATYAIVVLTLLHIVVVHAFSSGAF